MNNRCVAFLLILVLTVQVNSKDIKKVPQASQKVKTLNDFINGIKTRIDDLKSATQESIAKAEYSIKDMLLRSEIDRADLRVETTVTLKEQYDSICNRLNALKALSNITGTDINECLGNREAVILGLVQHAQDDLSTCLKPFVLELENIGIRTNHTIAEMINEVNAIYTQLATCSKDFFCEAEIVCIVKSKRGELRQKIADELKRNGEHVSFVDLQGKNCMDLAVAYVMETGSQLVDEIDTCIQDLIN